MFDSGSRTPHVGSLLWKMFCFLRALVWPIGQYLSDCFYFIRLLFYFIINLAWDLYFELAWAPQTFSRMLLKKLIGQPNNYNFIAYSLTTPLMNKLTGHPIAALIEGQTPRKMFSNFRKKFYYFKTILLIWATMLAHCPILVKTLNPKILSPLTKN